MRNRDPLCTLSLLFSFSVSGLQVTYGKLMLDLAKENTGSPFRAVWGECGAQLSCFGDCCQ